MTHVQSSTRMVRNAMWQPRAHVQIPCFDMAFVAQNGAIHQIVPFMESLFRMATMP